MANRVAPIAPLESFNPFLEELHVMIAPLVAFKLAHVRPLALRASLVVL